MADFKNRVKSFLGFGANESVAYDVSDDSYDYSDYDETENANEEAFDDFSISNYSTRASASDASNYRSKSESQRSNKSDNSTEKSRIYKMGAVANLKVVLSKPLQYEDCQAIGSHLRGHMTVVLNLELVKNASDKRRIYDFVSGCCYALDCNMQRVSEMIYVIAPMEVDIFSEAEEDDEEFTYTM